MLESFKLFKRQHSNFERCYLKTEKVQNSKRTLSLKHCLKSPKSLEL